MAMSKADELELEGNRLVEQYKKLEGEQEGIERSITALRSQILENNAVNEELELLDEDAQVFKSLGPVLVKLELADAKATVKQRLDRYESEIVRLDGVFKEKGEAKNKLLGQIQNFQNEVRKVKEGAAEE